MTYKLKLALSVACCALLAATFVSPALGGPSITSIGKTAKKALRAAKSADKRAAQAGRAANDAKSAAAAVGGTASQALNTANAANGKADQALARPVVTPQGITVVSQTATIDPSSFNSVAAVCPPGQRVISGGAVTVTDQGGTWLDAASDDRAAWLAGGEDVGGGGGEVTAEAYCAPAGQAVASSNARARLAARHQLQRLERRKAGAAKTCGAGYVHANLSWGEKCLRAGQYCKRGKNREYHRYGYHCKSNGRLRSY